MIVNSNSHLQKLNKDGTIKYWTRRCSRCDKLYKTPGKTSSICEACYLPKTWPKQYQAGIAQR